MNRRIDQIESELRKMKKEVSVANDADEKSRKAMDDLASVLREVSADATVTKEKLKATILEKEQLKLKLKSTNERLSEVMAECNKCKNEVERLRMEADETLAAWNEKESGLVGCMKKVEEERARAQAKNSSLQEEMRRLRDILKQAMTEAVGAKKAASLAEAENSELKIQLAEKDTTLNFVSRELESLRLSEADARDTQRESMRESNILNAVQISPEAVDHEKEYKKVGRTFSFDMGCGGKNKRFDDLVNKKAMVKAEKAESPDNASKLKRNMSCRFSEQTSINTERQPIIERQDALRKKALVKRIGELLSSKSSKSSC